ncbi:NAD(P)-dependent dehydrogenase (short-subunit alcohol dehydrogenase family) [Marinilabilia salmonicolor]|jgi:NAD(P)-dependent dehydrogenase (short-subunit alcohol dehydrogenase family)|uniref:SDR family NAD(P)-dependent oxidoreductase n=1 Tax=Marinilabilia salmonicolor TaxID=989 RepID=UPI000D06D58D|nr:SDR family oxidoreductase [Marinilabilia salmonicolor]PRY98786.1 NAD(P)-dependent dehydrogenase (short-subunit alcohol dehydrogenase family) [Marinilabilia salmonicolor]
MDSKKVILITGGSSGIGLSIAEKLAGQNYQVISLSRNKEKIERALKEKPNLKNKVDFIIGDVSSQDSINQLCSYIKENYGVLHGLVNSAGVITIGTLESLKADEWQKMLDINLTGPFLVTKTLLPLMKKANGASIINISSIAGLRPGTSIGYSVSKAGLDMLTRFLVADLGPYNIRVNSINPGLVKTHLHFDNNIFSNQEDYNKMVEGARVRHPLKKVGEPEDIANMVNFLLSDEASWISGAVIPLAGGVTEENGFLPPKEDALLK